MYEIYPADLIPWKVQVVLIISKWTSKYTLEQNAYTWQHFYEYFQDKTSGKGKINARKKTLESKMKTNQIIYWWMGIPAKQNLLTHSKLTEKSNIICHLSYVDIRKKLMKILNSDYQS